MAVSAITWGSFKGSLGSFKGVWGCYSSREAQVSATSRSPSEAWVRSAMLQGYLPQGVPSIWCPDFWGELPRPTPTKSSKLPGEHYKPLFDIPSEPLN